MSETKRPVGRPHELTPEVMECAWAYLRGGYREQGNLVPSVAGLAFALGKSRECMYEWARQNSEFSDILSCIATAQEMLLIDGGLGGEFNSSVTKMLLTKHGYSDKVENNHTSSDGSMTPQAAMSPEQFAELARAVADKV